MQIFSYFVFSIILTILYWLSLVESESFYPLTPYTMGKLFYRWLAFFGIESVIPLRRVTGRARRKLLRKYR
jgi:hypothetical protein